MKPWSPSGVKGCKAPPKTSPRRKESQLFLSTPAAYFSGVLDIFFSDTGERIYAFSPGYNSASFLGHQLLGQKPLSIEMQVFRPPGLWKGRFPSGIYFPFCSLFHHSKGTHLEVIYNRSRKSNLLGKKNLEEKAASKAQEGRIWDGNSCNFNCVSNLQRPSELWELAAWHCPALGVLNWAKEVGRWWWRQGRASTGTFQRGGKGQAGDVTQTQLYLQSCLYHSIMV